MTVTSRFIRTMNLAGLGAALALCGCMLSPEEHRDSSRSGGLPESRLVREAHGNIPLSFEANQGQADPEVRFLSRGPGYILFLTPR